MREEGTETRLSGSIRPGRTPQRQHPIEPQAIDRLNDARLLDMSCDRAQTECVERNGGRRSQESQVAEARRQLEIAHRQIALDVLLRNQPGDRCLLIAELIDQLEVDRLAAGEDTPVRG